MKKPQINRPPQKAPTEIPAAEGLVVTEEVETPEPASEVESETIPSDPLPSEPVDEPVVQQPTSESGMAFLGTFVLEGMVSRGNNGRVASLPVVAVSAGRIVGVLAVSDPGLIGEALAVRLGEAGYGSSFEFRTAGQLDRPTKLAAARSLALQQDPSLDRVGAVMSLGFNPSAIA